jgi:hypothetical protein
MCHKPQNPVFSTAGQFVDAVHSNFTNLCVVCTTLQESFHSVFAGQKGFREKRLDSSHDEKFPVPAVTFHVLLIVLPSVCNRRRTASPISFRARCGASISPAQFKHFNAPNPTDYYRHWAAIASTGHILQTTPRHGLP